ncbi:MAG: hypothetical protein J3R72DRAFT_429399 [Linnemannia gamsii]|nr:MAG: hypothetical protein J3R72DRAFT_429399 [Linnemannia gamsii]
MALPSMRPYYYYLACAFAFSSLFVARYAMLLPAQTETTRGRFHLFDFAHLFVSCRGHINHVQMCVRATPLSFFK